MTPVSEKGSPTPSGAVSQTHELPGFPPEAELPSVHRVLVVDDNPAIHDDFRKIFARRPGPAALPDLVFPGEESDPQPETRFDVDFALQGQQGLARVCDALR